MWRTTLRMIGHGISTLCHQLQEWGDISGLARRMPMASLLVPLLLVSCGTTQPATSNDVTARVPITVLIQTPPTPCECGAKADRIAVPIATILTTSAIPPTGVPAAATVTRAASATPAPAPIVSPSVTDSGASIVAQGLLVYKKYGCGGCHALRAAGATGTLAPSHDGIGARAAERITISGYTGHATNAETYIRESISDPDVYYVVGFEASQFRMPRYTAMTSAELDALVQVLLQQ